MPGVTEMRHSIEAVPALRKRPIAVSHVITTLSTGGAEMMLLKLLGGTDRSRFRSSVISLAGEGALAGKLRSLGVPVCALQVQPRGAISGLWRLACELRRHDPDIIQTWMYHADLLGGMASLALPRVPLVWNIRCGRLDRSIDKRSTIWISRACAGASRLLPARIICCSRACFETHAAGA